MKIFNFQFSIFNYSLSRAEGSKGFTLIELLVAMGIFLTVITLAVGSVVSAQRFQGRANLERQMQQLARDVTEKISTEVKNANGWVDTNGVLRTGYAPFEGTSTQLIIRRHREATNFLIIFRTITVTGNNKLQVASKSATGGGIPSITDSDYRDLIGPIGPTTYRLTLTNIFSTVGSFESAATQQPQITISLPVQANFGNTTVSMTLSSIVTSRFYNFKYSY